MKRCVTVAGAAVEGARGLLGRRVGVAAGGDDSARVQEVDQLERAVELGRERHLRDRACSEQALEECGVRVAAGVDRVGAEAERREERALEMGADHARPDRLARDLGERCDEVLLGRGDQRRLEGGDAVLEQRLAGAPVPGRVGAREVDAAEAVHLQVDEARDRDPAAAAAVRRRPP